MRGNPVRRSALFDIVDNAHHHVWIIVKELEHLWDPERLAYVSSTMVAGLTRGFLNQRMEAFDAPLDDGDQSQAAQLRPKFHELRII
eukprot:5306495-Pyramimonas_sp.AAC.1